MKDNTGNNFKKLYPNHIDITNDSFESTANKIKSELRILKNVGTMADFHTSSILKVMLGFVTPASKPINATHKSPDQEPNKNKEHGRG